MLRASRADAMGAWQEAYAECPLLDGIVALDDAVLFLDGELELFKLLDELVYLREIFDGSSLQGLQLRAQLCIAGLQPLLHAGTAPGLMLPFITTRLPGVSLAAALNNSTCRSSSLRGPYCRSGPTRRCNSP